MTAENLHPSTPETNDIKTQEGFLRELFDRSRRFIEEERGGVLVAEFYNLEVSDWSSHEFQPGRTVKLPMKIEKGLLFKDEIFSSALVLGKRKQSRYDRKENLAFEFGFFPDALGNASMEGEPIDRLRVLTQLRGPFVYGSGSLYENYDRIGVDCWADSERRMGITIGAWSAEKVLSEEGLAASSDLVKRVLKQGYPQM